MTTHANIELPTSSVTLQAGISDLANSDFTGRGTWSIVSQPAGANAGISGGTVYIFVSIRANVTNMTVPGDYVFQLIVTNPAPPNLTNANHLHRAIPRVPRPSSVPSRPLRPA